MIEKETSAAGNSRNTNEPAESPSATSEAAARSMLVSKAVDTRTFKRSLCVPPYQCHVIIEVSTVPSVFRMICEDILALPEPIDRSTHHRNEPTSNETP
jgi:hypothetical protein